ncbi:cytochrome c maturation protein CcmE, partial [Arthrobacter sp. 260]|uniref:cytochrome c maturation protein CcmE domain-containing protein n=1 Tax=Arthrobacter sp. 260 TaxID=2735314 RepID=UPI00320B31AD
MINDDAISFYLKDDKKMIKLFYKVILPDLFAEGKGAVVEGRLISSSQFIATNVLAKHDENYKPPN